MGHPTGPCRYPDKARYATKADALQAWRSLRRADHQKGRGGKRRKSKDVTPYRCDAGHWHLGRRPRKMREL